MTQVIELVFKNMIEIDEEVSDDWKSPPEGFNDDCLEDDDQKIIKISMDSIDKLLDVLGPEHMVPFLRNYIQKLLQSNDWKMIHAAVMTISQIGEYIDSDQQTEDLINILE